MFRTFCSYCQFAVSCLQRSRVQLIPCHYGIAHSKVPDGRHCLQEWRMAVDGSREVRLLELGHVTGASRECFTERKKATWKICI
jgi:hypothetical protein